MPPRPLLTGKILISKGSEVPSSPRLARGELETTMVDEWKARPDRPVAVPLLHVRFNEQLERLKQEPTWRTSRRNAITLNQEPALRLVLMLLGQGNQDARASGRPRASGRRGP